MAANDLLGKDLWENVLERLSFDAAKWWDKHRDVFVSATKADAVRIAVLLEAGETFEAKAVLARQMSPSELLAYQRRTLSELSGAAKRRADIMDALQEIGTDAAKIIGTTILGVLL